MDLPTVYAQKLIQNAKFDWISAIYRDAIPPEVQDSSDETIVLITEDINEPAAYANTTFKGWNIGVEVQIFYSKNLPENFKMMESELAFAKLFNDNDWQIEQSKNHIEDPDTGQVSKVFYFSKILLIKESK